MALELWTNDDHTVICEDGDVLGAYDAQYGLDDGIVQEITQELRKGLWRKINRESICFASLPSTIPSTADVTPINEAWAELYDWGVYESGYRFEVSMPAEGWASVYGVGILCSSLG